MGEVRKQSFYSLIAILGGFAIGALNQHLSLKYLTQEAYGLTGIFREVFTTFTMIATLGTLTTFHRFYPLYKHQLQRERNDLPALLLLVCITGLSLVLSGMYIFKPLIVRKFSENAPLFVEKFYLVTPLVITVLLTLIFEAYAYMLKRTIQFNLVKEIGFRLFQTIIIVMYILKWIDIDMFLILFSFVYVPSVFIMAWIAFSNQGIKLNFKISNLTKRIYKTIFSYTGFHFTGTLMSILPTAINSFLISSLSPNGLNDTAVYILARFCISVLEAPLRSITGVNLAMFSEAFHKRDFEKIGRLYQKTSINLLIIGIGIFILIYSNLSVVSYLYPGKNYTYISTIFLISGMAKLFELSMGMNDRIMYLSKYWKIDFYTSLVIILISIPINYILVKQNPLLGAAIGESIILVLYCLLRYYWVNKLLHLKPYTSKTLGLIIIGSISFAVAILLPISIHPIVDVAVRSAIFGILYLALLWFYQPSADFHEMLQKVVYKFKK